MTAPQRFPHDLQAESSAGSRYDQSHNPTFLLWLK